MRPPSPLCERLPPRWPDDTSSVELRLDSFASPARVHVHAVLFMGWVAIYLVQNILVATDRVHLHRRLGWLATFFYAACAGIRLARFNSRMDSDEQPHKSAGFLTGVPAPVGAGLAFVPLYLSLVTENPAFQRWQLVLPWTILVAALMISNVATFSWGSLRLRRSWRLFALAGVGLLVAALVTEPWLTLLAVSAIYVLLIPFSIIAYARVRRRRAAQA